MQQPLAGALAPETLQISEFLFLWYDYQAQPNFVSYVKDFLILAKFQIKIIVTYV